MFLSSTPFRSNFVHWAHNHYAAFILVPVWVHIVIVATPNIYLSHRNSGTHTRIATQKPHTQAIRIGKLQRRHFNLVTSSEC